ncbi:MAG: tetratricopeptide repeat protein [Myxococcota bacterium]|nr:tetratricopeptide repeat protein [Myxococcota bacterium]
MRLVLVLALVACGGRPAVRAPAAMVRSEVELAETAERARKHDVARVHYERAIALATDPASGAYARREFAETLATWGEVPAAITHLERSVALVGDDAAAWHDLGILKHNQGDMPGATTALERAKTLAPEDFRPRIALAALRWKTGDTPGAVTEYKALLDLELPDRLRTKVKWALDQLAKQ